MRVASVDRVLRDLRRLKSFLRGGFLWVGVLALAFGLGASMAAFNLLDAMLYRPLPVEDPQELVGLYRTGEERFSYGASSYPDYRDYRRSAEGLEDLAAYSHRPLVLTLRGSTERTWAGAVTVNYFQVLGLEASRGRLFLPEDEAAGSPVPVVLSHELWMDTLEGEPDVLGMEIRLNDSRRGSVIGIAPPGFRGTVFDHALDLWLPIQRDEELRSQRDTFWLETLIGRLRPGVGLEEARQELQAVAAGLAESHPAIHDGSGLHVVPLRLIAAPRSRRQAFSLYGVLFLASLLVVVAAANNLASLLLAGAYARRRGTSVVQAVGATRWQAARPFLFQGVVIVLLASGAGIGIAHWARDRILDLLPAWRAPLNLDLSIGPRSLAYLGALVLLMALGISLGPALMAARKRFMDSLQEGSGGPAGRGMTVLRRLLIGSQIPVALVLLIISGLMLRSLHEATQVELGFDGGDVQVMALETQLQELSEERTAEVYRRLLRAARDVPGVGTAALAQGHPFGFNWGRGELSLPGHDGEPPRVLTNVVSPEYFSALDVPLLQGRLFRETDDPDSATVGIVNAALVEELWSGESPVNRTVTLGGPQGRDVLVVGMVGSARYRRFSLPPAPMLYLSARQQTVANMNLLVESAAGGPPEVAALRRELRRIAPQVPLYSARSLTSFTNFLVWQQRMVGFFSIVLAAVTLVLGCLGVYGTIDYFTRRRTKEIAVRMALGSRRRDIVALILKQGSVSVAVGLAIGLFAAAATSKWLLGRLLFEVGTFDPPIFVGVPLLLLAVSLLAMWLPARRAARTEPSAGLRREA